MQDDVTLVDAALLIIGDEILSGRTQDKNTSYLASWLNEAGIQLQEVRVVADDEAAIGSALNTLRTQYTYVFTTGGIGPTHDDITAESVARAFDVALDVHPEAYARLHAYYGDAEFTDARKRMTRVPQGGVLIDNPVSIAPGFQIENVFVLAGVPKIMQAMLEELRPRLQSGRKVHSASMTVYWAESKMAALLEEIETDGNAISIGSYPFYHEKNSGTQVVVRSIHKNEIEKAMSSLERYVHENAIRAESPTYN